MSIIENRVIPIDRLVPHPRNYRSHPEGQIKKIRASLIRYGQVRSVVVQEGAGGNYLIVAGHGLTQAAKLENFRELKADIIPADWLPQEIEGYLLADNVGGADDDMLVLAQMLEEQVNAGYSPESVGTSDAELAQLLEDLTKAALKEKEAEKEPESEAVDEEPPMAPNVIECPACGHQFVVGLGVVEDNGKPKRSKRKQKRS